MIMFMMLRDVRPCKKYTRSEREDKDEEKSDD